MQPLNEFRLANVVNTTCWSSIRLGKKKQWQNTAPWSISIHQCCFPRVDFSGRGEKVVSCIWGCKGEALHRRSAGASAVNHGRRRRHLLSSEPLISMQWACWPRHREKIGEGISSAPVNSAAASRTDLFRWNPSQRHTWGGGLEASI